MNSSAKVVISSNRSKKVPVRGFDKPKTLSYTQLKEENSILHQRNADLEHKVSKQNNALTAAQRNAKTFEKENQTLKEQLEEERKQQTEYVENVTKQWTTDKEMLTDKLLRCEMKLEDLGVNPVTLDDGTNTYEDKLLKQEAAKRAEVLRERLEENISNSQNFLQRMQEIAMQSREALKQLDC
ncbi:uncharacterized protein LOC110990319 [Acanthaster planci]|uniref:Uncharacterized protein LOC110990319 n=1 Tax=Acanthaster planci TaxID=133434 RepID=A0A8B8A4T5_ACAPL|nr:uncharacterized protein LOC110990319 [Acanthaster planci]